MEQNEDQTKKDPKDAIREHNAQFDEKLKEFGADVNNDDYGKLMANGKILHVDVEKIDEDHSFCTVDYKSGPYEKVVIERNASGEITTYKYQEFKIGLGREIDEKTVDEVTHGSYQRWMNDRSEQKKNEMAGGDNLEPEEEVLSH